ncbi:unnamed protein product [Ambrosiozyma monospora]|uniref:Unnamed protein product n=1 Tax=Ambrosiozyma monospora TaxID=43982 RepID=A0ACB5UAI8_AMBMO|nr:unnamed protein product [Ambrosiozyma monospora]
MGNSTEVGLFGLDLEPASSGGSPPPDDEPPAAPAAEEADPEFLIEVDDFDFLTGFSDLSLLSFSFSCSVGLSSDFGSVSDDDD